MKLLLTYWRSFLSWLRNDTAEDPKPRLVYVDADGVGWCRRPDYQDASEPDTGQHDTWKREMRVFLFRALNGESEASGMLDMRRVGVGERMENVPNLYPMGMQVADACRRLGFSRLARSAMPGISGDALELFYEKHEAAVVREAERRFADCVKLRDGWDEARMGRPFLFESVEETVALLTVGPLHGVDTPTLLVPFEPLAVAGLSHDHFTRSKRAK